MPAQPASPRAVPPVESRANYPHLTTIATRWMDNDLYGHVNNAVYYSFFDTVINNYLIGARRARYLRRCADRSRRRDTLQFSSSVGLSRPDHRRPARRAPGHLQRSL